MLSTWRNRTLKDVWFGNKTWWLSALPLPEPLRSPISPCDFLCTYFPYYNRLWLFHICSVVCLRGKTSCPLSPFPSSIWWCLLPARLRPHGISLGAGRPRAPPQPCRWPRVGSPASSETSFLGEKIKVAPTRPDAVQTRGSKSALHLGGLCLKCKSCSGCCTWQFLPQTSCAKVPASSLLQLLFAAMGGLLK